MSQQGVKMLIGRLVGDDAFRKHFFADPQKVAEESGYHLDAHELASIAKLKASDLAVNVKHGPGAVATYELDVRSAKV
jgi:hypothetical protein